MDTNVLEAYKRYLTPFYKTQVDNRVVNYGRDNTLQMHIDWTDCTKRFPDGSRIIQVNSHNYESEMAQLLYLIDTYFDDVKDELYDKVLKHHENNVQYDIDNPPTITPKSKQKTPRRKKDTPSAAELKAKAKAMKIGALKFNIKHELKHE